MKKIKINGGLAPPAVHIDPPLNMSRLRAGLEYDFFFQFKSIPGREWVLRSRLNQVLVDSTPS